MGLFDNVRSEILEEFSSYVGVDNFIYDSFSKQGKISLSFFSAKSEPINTKKNCELIKLLEEKRWGYKVTCVRCFSDNVFETFGRNDNFRCSKCLKNFNVFTDTLLSNAKIPVNIYYDAVQEYRNNPNVSSVSLSKKFNVTQKTIWNILAKIKLIPISLEKDISILSVLLHESCTNNNLPKKKLSFDKWEYDCIERCTELYKGQPEKYISTIKNLFFILKVQYSNNCDKLANDLGLSKQNFSRYITGKRSIKMIRSELSDNINKKIMDLYTKTETYANNLPKQKLQSNG